MPDLEGPHPQTHEIGSMKYYMKVLQPDETVRFAGKLHWIIYRHAILLAILTVIVAVFALSLTNENQKFLALIAAAILAAVTVVSLLRAWFQQWTTEIAVTDKRVISKQGFIARHTQEMNISKVETVDVSQSIWGRILGFGTVAIVGTGASLEPLRYVATPLRLRNAIIVG
jgi:uncharacterized membrane protein YdbT with pleckstrin-like domain